MLRATSLIVVSALMSLIASEATYAVDRPNIIFVMIDDLGPEWVNCYGAEDIETPHIDSLAASGMKFLNAYSMPQCTPTRATLLTGQYPFRHGWVNHWDVPRWGAGCHFDAKYNVTFARQLKSVGYMTGIAGKWQINDFRVQPGVLKEHGFDEWCMWTGFETDNPPSAERYWDPYVFQNVTGPGYEGPTLNIRHIEADGPRVAGTYSERFGPDVYNAFCCDFVGRHKDEPFLLYYPMCLTHGPLVHTPDEPDESDKLAKHKAMVRYTDKLIGRIVDAIDAAGVRERTILIITTDNGTSGGLTGHMSGRAVQGGKGKVTENGVREPFIANCPSIVPAGVETECLTDFTDLLPTFCELAGAPLPEGVTLDGKSIAPVLLGKADDGPREWIMAMGHGPARLDEQGVRPVVDFTHRVIRDKQFKIHVSDGREITALYDLIDDPAEERNLIASTMPLHRKAIKRLTSALESMPAKDARPQYDATPPQRWDQRPE
ncbi:MAG: sulfatase-like hydrolase/transferase [Planctomycetaceae bacterium]